MFFGGWQLALLTPAVFDLLQRVHFVGVVLILRQFPGLEGGVVERR